jgi:hypothetical protein
VKKVALEIIPFRHYQDYGFRKLAKGPKSNAFLIQFFFWLDEDGHHVALSRPIHAIMQERPQLVTNDNPFKVGPLVFQQYHQKKLRIWRSFALVVDPQGTGNQ